LDLEAYWLAKELRECVGLLSPPLEALDATRKPEIAAHRLLPFAIPPYISMMQPGPALNSFCREYGWPIWVKSPYYEARRVTDWQELNTVASVLRETWSTHDLFLQAHISGNEESLAFAAHQGELLSCIWMKKKDITIEGKTWAGRVSLPPPEIADSLSQVLRYLRWTGGGELEFVRDVRDQLWLIEWNPRFPAWIYGGTIAGYNLPADLLSKYCGVEPRPPSQSTLEFVRVVLEIPARSDFPLLETSEPSVSFSLTPKHPSGMPLLARRLRGVVLPPQNVHESKFADTPASMIKDLNNARLDDLKTPVPLFLPSVANSLMKRISELSTRLSSGRVKTLIAYSIKTNPDVRLLNLARLHGLMVEAISADELSTVLRMGFSAETVVSNGPGKAWPTACSERVLASFCDSLEELERAIILARRGRAPAKIIGVRIKPPNVRSRFGVRLDTSREFARLTNFVRMIPSDLEFGVHFHIASSALGIPAWWGVFDSTLNWALALENIAKKRIACLDLGGGWFPEDLLNSDHTEAHLREAIQRTERALQGLSRVILEPGKALSQPTFAVIMKVLEIRRNGEDISEIVVDGSVGEVNQSQYYPHTPLAFDSKLRKWQGLGRGRSRILGRLCMENDILVEDVHLPTTLCVGEFIAFCDSGAYDRSMAYSFGRGT